MDHPDTERTDSIAGLLAALTHIDNVGFHGIARTLTGPEPTIDRNWAPLIRNARIAAGVTAWPAGLHQASERFGTAADNLVAVLERRDLDAVAEPARELHVAYHALSDAGWRHLAAEAGIAGSAEHQHGAGQDHH
ncbi:MULTISPECIES: hypothetical protein [unclassified Paenarthrobacter]|uniref:hypothetical protein n=1 Tax=unclassified Paenarthrobacter TaxID=2634190 RepID=UPI0014221A64|nr:hypothetical protein [Paenarthrobacter sp. MSM-2-10-13]NHW49323.1 hypothetical protein [Paenarthrobacter sp. MSM-2-10-13]